MLKTIKYLVFLSVIATACESVYVPDLDGTNDVLTVDARFVYGKSIHVVTLKSSMGFNEGGGFASYSGATVSVKDDLGNTFDAVENGFGEYTFHLNLDSVRQYQLIISVGDDVYVSDFESVPPPPEIDSFYTEPAEKLIQPGGETDVGDFVETEGHQFFVDVDGEEEQRYYRFDARKILEYTFPFDTFIGTRIETVTKFAWKSLYPTGIFDIAGPADYSAATDIVKHPTEFFVYDEEKYLSRENYEVGNGWVYIMYQYGISQSAYNFYKDLNAQLGNEGKIFDPMYVQARNNLRCESDPGKVVLGYFEVSNFKEHRFYIRLDRLLERHEIRRLEHFYNIPESGNKAINTPWFWEA